MNALIKIGATSTEQTENELLSELIKKLNITIKDEEFISEQKDGDTSFSRDRVFTFKVLLSFLMTNLQKVYSVKLPYSQKPFKVKAKAFPK